MPTESEISKKFTKALRDQGAIVFKVHGHTMQQPGWPDFYLVIDGWQGWIETKGANTKVTRLQIVLMRRLKAKRVNAYVLRFITDRHFSIEDENGGRFTDFTFKNWNQGAQIFMDALYHLGGSSEWD